MTVQTHPATQSHDSRQRSADAPPRHLAAGRRIVVAVLAGAAAALLLSLVVLAGGTEATATGALLLGFAVGWALIATLTRRTSEPQRWAVVPASAMGASGTALVVLTPGNETMAALNWVWPPLLLVLSVWMLTQVRRSVRGRARWVLTPVILVLVVASIGATYANLAGTDDLDSYPAPGKLYDVGGHRLHLDCRGHGRPTVVLSNGLGEVSASWARVSGAVASTSRVCAYDRAGQGWSDDVDRPQDGVESAEDLHTLLSAAGEQGPFVLVGHSTGGTYVLTYTARYPDQVAGVVLLDSSSPEQFTRMPAYPAQYAVMRRGLAMLPTLHRLGLNQLLAPASHLPSPAAKTVTALTSTTRAARGQRDEVSVLPQVFSQAQELTTLGDRPLAVLTAAENSRGTDGWAAAQDVLAALSTDHVHRTVESSHTGLLEDVRPAAESVRAITEVISSVRTHTPLGTS